MATNVNRLETWLVLDSSNPAYAGVLASVTAFTLAHHSAIQITDGRWTNSKVIYCQMTEVEFLTLGISPGTGVMLCRFSYALLYNENYASAAITVTEYGDNRLTYGVYPAPTTAMPTTTVDKAVAWAKGGAGAWVFANTDGTGDGSARATPISVHDLTGVSPPSLVYDGIIWIGVISRFANEGNGAGGITIGAAVPAKTGSSGSPTVWISDMDERAYMMGGCKLGNGANGEDVNWTDDGGGRWSIHSTSTAGGGDPYGAPAFVMTLVDGVPTPLTKVASAAAVSATPGSWFISSVSGDSNIYVRRVDGADPKNITFVGPSTAGGVAYSPINNYVDHAGIQYLMQGLYTFNGGGSYNRFYNCKHKFFQPPTIRDRLPEVTEATGAMSFDACTVGRVFHGHELAYSSAGWYDASTPCNIVPTDTSIIDPYIHDIGNEAADAYGVLLATPGDSHCDAFEGGNIRRTVRNFRGDRIGPEAIVPYIRTANFANPAGTPLEDTPGYTVGFPVDKCWTRADLSRQFCSPAIDLLYEDLLLTRPWTGGSYALTEGMAMSCNGDGNPYGYAGQISNVKFRRARIEGPFTTGARNKWVIDLDGGGAYSDVEFEDIITRGVVNGHYTFGNVETQYAGVAGESSWWVHGSGTPGRSSFHATTYFGRYINHAVGAMRLRVYEDNL